RGCSTSSLLSELQRAIVSRQAARRIGPGVRGWISIFVVTRRARLDRLGMEIEGRIPMIRISAGVVYLSLAASALGQNLLRNGDFEDVPGNQQGQGILPSEWIQVQPSVDTYSNDGSYGLPPNGFGNFTGVTAFSGIRWIGGWSSIPEIFGQALTAPLVPGRGYLLRARLRIAERSDLRSPGTYDISLRGSGPAPLNVGRLGAFVT